MMSVLSGFLPVAAILWPLLLLGVCLFSRAGNRFTPWLIAAPVPAVLAAVFSGGVVVTLSPSTTMPLRLAVDGPGAVLLGVSALLWAAAAAGLVEKLADSPHRRRLTVCWLLTLTGNLGVFLAADVMGFFVFFALASLPAYGLVIHEESAAAKKAGVVYLGFALLGEALLLMGLVLLVLNPSGGGFGIAGAVAALPDSPWMVPTLVLLVAAFGLKIGLVPAHGWLPMAHTVAPGPASAVLSGAILNAGVMGLIRFVPFGEVFSGGLWLVVPGFTGAFFGVAVGLCRSHPKAVLAYSSVSQMGFIAAVSGMAMIHGSAAIAIPLAFYAAHHTLLKGGLFMAVGCVASDDGVRLRTVVLPALLIGLGLAGLPLTGGALAKLAVKDGFGDGLAGWLAIGSSAATAGLMTHFIRCLLRAGASSTGGVAKPVPLLPLLAWWLLALGAVVVPWLLRPLVETFTLASVLSPSEWWKAGWPVALGVLAGWWLGRVDQRPTDVADESRWYHAPVRSIGRGCEGFDRALRLWSVAGIILVALVLALALML